LITSPANPHIKMLRKLQTRKYRDETGWYYLEGPRQVQEAISMKAPIEYLVVCPELLTSPDDTLRQINTHLRIDQVLVKVFPQRMVQKVWPQCFTSNGQI
jgi:tRNA G18 (ribose-2'-O)-methylase SpoU